MKQQANRRDFLKVAAGAMAVPYLIPGSALGTDGRPAQRPHRHGRHRHRQPRLRRSRAFLGRGDVQYVAVCDVNEQHLKAR